MIQRKRRLELYSSGKVSNVRTFISSMQNLCQGDLTTSKWRFKPVVARRDTMAFSGQCRLRSDRTESAVWSWIDIVRFVGICP